MGKGTRNSESSDQIDLFLKGLSDMGFGNLPYDVLLDFHILINDQFGYTPIPEDPNWEGVLKIAEEMFVGD